MLRSMYSAISGMQGFATKLDVIGNNIANVNTPGFKSGRVDFADVLSQTISGGSAPAGSNGGTNPVQVGLGMRVAGIDTLFTQGADQSTGVSTDLAINGAGFFTVTDSSGQTYLTRAGDFSVDAAGNLVLPDGKVAAGFKGSTPPTSSATPTAVNLKNWVPSGNTLAEAPDVQIGPDGSVSAMVNDSSGNVSRATLGYLAIATVPNPGGLQKVGDTLFVEGSNSGPVTYQVAGTNNTGSVASGYLEMSNVDLTREFTEMIVAQRGFDANSHIIGTANAILQDIVNLKNS
ncbi:flagellar hook-basal body complex protein [Alicyclobacillus sp.]|uniref:flagellar hook-basal body complex protein n=1 Tax=Alicyclobacillus sp. TaxID=61169 RepID=UPI0025C6913E|nr:flagellar hook-basal body complex protein [Alicyclobacillus sp.]MCL6515632.1 flagellar hook-basal body complex protein [Alicyclobacillus sp.]